MSQENQESLDKALDEAIDKLFGEEIPQEPVEKAGYTYPAEEGKADNKSSLMQDGSSAAENIQTSEESLNAAPNIKKQDEEENGRPKETQDVPDRDQDGERAKGYEHVQEEQKQTPNTSDDLTTVKSSQEEKDLEKADDSMSVKEAVDKILDKKHEVQDVLPQVPKEKQDDVLKKLREMGRKIEDKELPNDYKEAKQMAKKSQTVEISQEDYEFLQKAKKEKQEEELRKAEEKQQQLIKSAIAEATQDLKQENEDLKKSLQEMQEKVEKVARRPQPSKAVTDVNQVQAVEKSFGDQDGSQENLEKSGGEQDNTLGKSEMMDLGEELVKAGKLTQEQFIELENTGYIADPNARNVFEQEARKKYRS